MLPISLPVAATTNGGLLGEPPSTESAALVAAFLAPAALGQCLRGERNRSRCASRPPPQLRDGLRRFLAGLARSSREPTAASDANDCDLPSKNLDNPLLIGSCVIRADISKWSAELEEEEEEEEEEELASSASSEEEAAELLDVASESEAEPMSSSCSSYAILGATTIHAARPTSKYASI